MNKDLQIKQLLDAGKSIRNIASELGVSDKTVQRVKKYGAYYINLKTQEIIFSSKKISIEQQITNYIANKKLNKVNLAKYFNTTSRTISRWIESTPPLVLCNNDGTIKQEVLDKICKCLEELGDTIFKSKKRRRQTTTNTYQGLYFLYQNNVLQYIGKSKHIQIRLVQHMTNSHVKELNGKYQYKTIKVENEVDLELLERIFIKLLKPKLNIDYSTDKDMGELFKGFVSMIPKEYEGEFVVSASWGDKSAKTPNQ